MGRVRCEAFGEVRFQVVIRVSFKDVSNRLLFGLEICIWSSVNAAVT